MALLNKLFFPSATSVSAAAAPSLSSNATISTTAPTNTWTSSTVGSTGSTANTFDKNNAKNQNVHSKNYLNQFPFDGRQVRVLLYRESDRKGRRLLFDSSALQKVMLKDTNESPKKGGSSGKEGHTLFLKNRSIKTPPINDFIEVCNEYGYKHNRPNSADITSIGEMVFGALAMSFRGTALKVHWLRAPSRILCSQVFFTPISPGYSQSPYSTITFNTLSTPRTSISSEQGSIDGLSLGSFTAPFSVCVDRRLSDQTNMTSPVDVPENMSLSTNSESGARFSSTYSTATDSGYSISRGRMSSDQWSASYQYSTRSSIGSVISEHSDMLPKANLTSPLLATVGNGHFVEDIASDGCLQRRIFRNICTSFENEQSVNDFIGFISDAFPVSNGGGSEGAYIGVPNYRRASYSANESRSNPEIGRRREPNAIKSVSRRVKLGLAVCLTMSESFEDEMELFCSEHIALLESMLSRLRARTESAYRNHREFLQILYQAWQETQQWFTDLFTAPRIKCPVWLSITTSGSKYSKNVADRFMKELCWLLSLADTKDTNFFISTMLTAVLTHHLGWVSTVAAFSRSSSSRAVTAAAAIEQREKLQQISQKHPYNALWAQMGDLFGAIGVPPKLTRTIIYGTEKLSVERMLNVLTYFIRCGEVRRVAKKEDFNKEHITFLSTECEGDVGKNRLHGGTCANSIAGLSKLPSQGSGLVRIPTCKQNLSNIAEQYNLDSKNDNSKPCGALESPDADVVRTHKRNEIPNVLAFRDSRFVQQELRIGNYLMDTGIEKNSVKQMNQQVGNSMPTSNKDSRIRLTVTTPDNVELSVEDMNAVSSQSTDEGVLEAIDLSDVTTNAEGASEHVDDNFFWNIAPLSVKEGVSLKAYESVGGAVNPKFAQHASFHVLAHSKEEAALEKRTSHLSLSDLITQNSIGKSERMTWGIEPIKENLSLEEQMHFEHCQKLIEQEHGISHSNLTSMTNTEGSGSGSGSGSGGVVFVLGDNEPLVNIKKSNEDLTAKELPEPLSKQQEFICKSLCSLHQRSYGKLASSKKHSGVKFNFEQYPQIVTNYMKRKNLVLSNYEVLTDKWSKLESQDDGSSAKQSITGAGSNTGSSGTANRPPAETTECVVCNSCLDLYQTPSNATELEFEADQEHYNPTPAPAIGYPMHKISSTASVDTLKCVLNAGDFAVSPPSKLESHAALPEAINMQAQKLVWSGVGKKLQTSSMLGAITSMPALLPDDDAVHLLELPVPGIKEVSQEDDPPNDMKLRAGFVPSLFMNVSDHYMSDMVLQGTFASPNNWEHTLRESLAMAAHSASLVSLPVENMAIVADMENWNVRLLSSQPQRFASDDSQSAPVGMSQFVSSMLETVHAMYNSGISAYECLSFLESKLQEIYLQSETLAAFLLETDFCSLNAVTTAFSLSENDVPLLLSIASIHTPQISNKYGISFI